MSVYESELQEPESPQSPIQPSPSTFQSSRGALQFRGRRFRSPVSRQVHSRPSQLPESQEPQVYADHWSYATSDDEPSASRGQGGQGGTGRDGTGRDGTGSG